MNERNELDFILHADINRLISILRKKTMKLRKFDKISPMIYGIYGQEENFNPQEKKREIVEKLQEI